MSQCSEPPTDITVPPTSSPAHRTGLYTLMDDIDDIDMEVDDDVSHILNSEPPEAPETTETAAAAAAPGAADVDFDNLGLYYSRFFPMKSLHRWLNHSPRTGRDFTFREFAFTLRNGAYLRYNSFSDEREFKARVEQLCPERFEIGAVYSHNPKDRKKLRKDVFKPVSKELVFDIDMDDYDKFRTCCSGANVCNKCWRYVQVAVKMVTEALRDDFGYTHVLWVYSGRRGAHAWVCDKKARDLDDKQRSAIVAYLSVLPEKGNLLKRPLHPHLQRSLDLATTQFHEVVLQEQDPWANEAGSNFLLSFIPDEKLRRALNERWKAHNHNVPSMLKWREIDEVASEGVSANLDTKKLKEAKQDIILHVFFPKLDGAVSRGAGHLLKSPFCVHPKTANVCVPMAVDADANLLFTPDQCPKLPEIVDDFNADPENASAKIPSSKTRLAEYVDIFASFVDVLVKEEVERVRAANATTMDF